MPQRDDTPSEVLHRFEHAGKRFAIDVETCFCFECDAVSWDVLEFYPHTTPNRIVHLLADRHNPVEVGEVISELEWLRSTKSIVPHLKAQDIPSIFTIEHGLKHVVAILPAEEAAAERAHRRWFTRHEPHTQSAKAMDIGRGAIALLFARAGDQKDLRFELRLGAPADPAPVVEALAAEAFRMAALAGKKLTVAATLPLEASFEGHGLTARLELTRGEGAADHVRALIKAGAAIAKLAKVGADDDHVRLCLTLRPDTPQCAAAVRALHEAGLQDIEIDLEAAFAENPAIDPHALHQGLAEVAEYYADRLLKNDYFRIEPIASLFARIYHGMPTRRADPAGVQALLVDAEGSIWPNLSFITLAMRSARDAATPPADAPAGDHRDSTLQLGNILTGAWDAANAARFADVGVTGTSACMRCWARHLCGGGSAAVHHALTGSMRTPQDNWCDAQRAWTAAAVSAFNLLSSQGVHFTRIYQTLNRRGRPSLFQLARTALKMSVIMRPLAEADAPMLREWENWNEASYFLLKPNATLLTTQYDREMDALYPHGNTQEMLLTTRRGEAIGLARMQPDKWPGTHRAWLYLHRPTDYASPANRNGFRELLKQIALAQDIRRITFHAADYESPLNEFYAACGFQHEGTLRQALYLTKRYYDVNIYAATTAEL